MVLFLQRVCKLNLNIEHSIHGKEEGIKQSALDRKGDLVNCLSSSRVFGVRIDGIECWINQNGFALVDKQVPLSKINITQKEST